MHPDIHVNASCCYESSYDHLFSIHGAAMFISSLSFLRSGSAEKSSHIDLKKHFGKVLFDETYLIVERDYELTLSSRINSRTGFKLPDGGESFEFALENLDEKELAQSRTSLWWGRTLSAPPPRPTQRVGRDEKNEFKKKLSTTRFERDSRVLVVPGQEQGFASVGSTSFPRGFLPIPRLFHDCKCLASTLSPPPISRMPTRTSTASVGLYPGGPAHYRFPRARPLSAYWVQGLLQPASRRRPHNFYINVNSVHSDTLLLIGIYIDGVVLGLPSSLSICHSGLALSASKCADPESAVLLESLAKMQIPAFAGMTKSTLKIVTQSTSTTSNPIPIPFGAGE